MREKGGEDHGQLSKHGLKMSGIKISEPERIAVVLKKLITPGIADPDLKHIENLPLEYREIVHLIREEGKNKAAREARLKAELIANDPQGILGQLDLVDAAIDLDQVEIADSWKFASLEEACQPLPPLEWIVDGIISKPSVTIFFGAPKSMKTLLLQDLAMCVAHGLNWLPGLPDKSSHKGFATSSTRVLWIDYENGVRRMKERLSAFTRGLNIKDPKNLWWIVNPRPWLDASEKDHIGDLMQRIEKYKAGLVVIDHLAQVIGDVDLNTSPMAEIMGNFRVMVDELNIALIMAHHQVKSASRYGIKASESLSGHASILAGCDLAFLVERNENQEDQISIVPAAVRGPTVPKLSALFSYKQKSGKSHELEEAKFWNIDYEDLKEKTEAAIIDILRDEPNLNQSDLIIAVGDCVEGVGDYKARRVIGKMVREHKIIRGKGPKGSKIYRLPEE